MQDANEVKPAQSRLVYPRVMAVSSDVILGEEWDSRGTDGAHSAAVAGERWRQDGEREKDASALELYSRAWMIIG